MRLVDNRSHRDPAMNLALEEFLLDRYSDCAPLLVYYVNAPVVVLGRNQIPFLEVNLNRIMRQKVAVVRRISGGGAVYHEPGNLNFSLIQAAGKEAFPSAGDAVRPVVDSLNKLGLPARLTQRHDIVLGEDKITGTAQYRTRGTCLTHGTLLVAADLESLRRILISDSEIPFFRGRASVRSPVTNIATHRPDLTMETLCAALTQSFAAIHGQAEPLRLSTVDWDAIERLARIKYQSWDWTVGKSPEFKIRREALLFGVWCAALIQIRRGVVGGIALVSPEPAPSAVVRLAGRLEGLRYRFEDMLEAVKAAGFDHYGADASRQVAEWLCPPPLWWRSSA